MINQCYLRKLISPCLIWTIVLAALLSPFGSSVAWAQAVPPACLNDAGQPIRPNPAYLDPGWTNAWVLLLNFNHALSASYTTGCIGMITAANPQPVSYQLIQCPLQNNINQIRVGGGTAPFDGNFWIECPGITQNNYVHASFGVWGRARFPTSNQSYLLMSHQDVAVKAAVDATWHITLDSRYGVNTYNNFANQVNVAGKIVPFKSEVDRTLGTHYINNQALTPHFNVAGFPFDESQPITIGAAGQTMTLYEMIVDPPGMCCRSQ